MKCVYTTWLQLPLLRPRHHISTKVENVLFKQYKIGSIDPPNPNLVRLELVLKSRVKFINQINVDGQHIAFNGMTWSVLFFYGFELAFGFTACKTNSYIISMNAHMQVLFVCADTKLTHFKKKIRPTKIKDRKSFVH